MAATRKTAAFTLLALALIIPLAETSCRFRAIFNFGDSNSDTGGFWAAFPSLHPPYGMTFFKRPAGRGTDGRLVIDFLAQAIGLPFLSPYLQSIGSRYQHGANFATAASTALMPVTSVFVTGISPFYLGIQINQMKAFRAKVLQASSHAQSMGLPFLSPYLQSIGSSFKHGANFATLASTVLMPVSSLFVTGISPFFLVIQINQMKDFRARVLRASSHDNLPHKNIFGRALFTFDIGQNDFTSNLAKIGIHGVQLYLPQVADQIAGSIKELYEIGGRTFFVFNLAPVGCFPALLTELPHDTEDLDVYGCMISYNKAVVDYNNLLNQTLHEIRIQLKDASVVYVDTHSVKLELYRNPKKHGLLYATRACCGYGGGDYNFDPRLFCGNTKEIDGRIVSATACSDPENYVSWDGIHGSEAANKILTSAILKGSYFYPPFPLSELCDLQQIG